MSAYSAHIEQYSEQLSQTDPRHRTALSQLASLLAHPIFQIGAQGTGHIDSRRKMIEAFCIICQNARIPLPPGEQKLYEAIVNAVFLKEPNKATTRFATQVDARLRPAKQPVPNGQKKKKGRAKGTRATPKHTQVRTLLSALRYFEQAKYSLTPETIQAAINLELMRAGLEPVHNIGTDTQWHYPDSTDLLEEEVIVLIIDDRKADIADTILKLVGWKNIVFHVHFHIRDSSYDIRKNADKLRRIVAETTQALLNKNPDIVLIDEGLGDISGADLVPQIRELAPSVALIANTGGEGAEFARVNLQGNLEKGRNIRYFARAVRSIASQRRHSA